MKTLSKFVLLLAVFLPAQNCMSQTEEPRAGEPPARASTDLPESAEQAAQPKLIGFSERGLRILLADGEEKFYPLDDLQGYRLQDGKLEVKHVSGEVIVLPPESLGDSAELREGQWHMLSLKGVDAQYIEVEAIEEGEDICLKTLDGKTEYPIDELIAYRVRNGKVQIKHKSGVVLMTRLENANREMAKTGGEWRKIGGDGPSGRRQLFPGARRNREAVSAFEKDFKEAFGMVPDEIPTSLIALVAACLVVDLVFFICFGLVLCTMFLNGEVTTAVLCAVFTCIIGCGPLMGLFYGWKNCQAWRIQKLMVVWSIVWVIGIGLNVVLFITIPDILLQMNPNFAQYQG